MKNGTTYFKYTAIVIVALIVVYLSRCKFDCNGTGSSKTDTIRVVRDTVIHRVDTFVRRVPVPYKVTLHDTLEMEHEVIKWETIPSILKEAYSDYSSKKYYKDSFDIAYGKIYLADTVHRNKLTGSSFSLQQSIPEITNTITLREPKRAVLYAGVTGIGNQSTPVYAVGGKLGLMAKNGKYYGGSYLLTKSGSVMYQADILIPIRLRRK